MGGWGVGGGWRWGRGLAGEGVGGVEGAVGVQSYLKQTKKKPIMLSSTITKREGEREKPSTTVSIKYTAVLVHNTVSSH